MRKSSDKSKLVLLKTGSVVVGLIGTGIAYYMAQLKIESMFMIWNEIMALLGGGFVGVYLLGMFTTRANSVGAVIGIAFSVLTVLVAKNYTDMHVFLYTPVALAACLLFGYAGSFFGPRPEAPALKGLTLFGPKS